LPSAGVAGSPRTRVVYVPPPLCVAGLHGLLCQKDPLVVFSVFSVAVLAILLVLETQKSRRYELDGRGGVLAKQVHVRPVFASIVRRE